MASHRKHQAQSSSGFLPRSTSLCFWVSRTVHRGRGRSLPLRPARDRAGKIFQRPSKTGPSIVNSAYDSLVDLILEIPKRFAEELFEDDTAFVPVSDRSSADLAHAIIDVVGVTAGLVTVIVDGVKLPEISRRLASWIRRSNPPHPEHNDQWEIRITRPSGVTTVVVIPATPGSADLDAAAIVASITDAAE